MPRHPVRSRLTTVQHLQNNDVRRLSRRYYNVCTKNIYLLGTCNRLPTWQACAWRTKTTTLSDHTQWVCRACLSTCLQNCHDKKIDVWSCLNRCLHCRNCISWRGLPIWSDNHHCQSCQIPPPVAQLLVSREVSSTKEVPATIPNTCPHITIFIIMMERSIRAVDDCLQCHLSKDKKNWVKLHISKKAYANE